MNESAAPIYRTLVRNLPATSVHTSNFALRRPPSLRNFLAALSLSRWWYWRVYYHRFLYPFQCLDSGLPYYKASWALRDFAVIDGGNRAALYTLGRTGFNPFRLSLSSFFPYAITEVCARLVNYSIHIWQVKDTNCLLQVPLFSRHWRFLLYADGKKKTKMGEEESRFDPIKNSFGKKLSLFIKNAP